MRKIITIVACLLIGLTGQTLHAQDSTATKQDSTKLDSTVTTKHRPHSHLIASIDYQSNSVYMGRKDSTALPYLIPTLAYYHKSGFYITTSAAWLKTADVSRIDLITIGTGFTFSAGKYDGDFSASKYFYNTQSTSVTSTITASFSYLNTYDFGFVKAVLSGQVNTGTNTDFEGAFGLEHSFGLFDDALEITPSFLANAGTLNYYSNYYKTRRFNRKKAKNPVSGTVAITGTVVNPGAFTILDYEASLPISYVAGKYTFSATPAFSIPVNPARIDLHYAYSTGTTANRQHVEDISNTFYLTLGISRRF